MPRLTPPSARTSEVLRGLGIDEPRPEQLEAIEHVSDGRNVLVVLPTGFGKSAIYQVAAEMLDGPTIVVGPLLALQHDQISSLRDKAQSTAERVDGATGAVERRSMLDRFASGAVEYLFATPETLESDDVIEAAQAARVSLFVVDEAHCVTTWGRGFRPAFARLGETRRTLGRPVCLALTASADERMRDDIADALGLDDYISVVGSVVRPEIRLSVRRHGSDEDAESAIVESVVSGDVKTIVYVPRRRIAEDLAISTTTAGRRAEPFHGGLSASRKTAVAEWFSHEPDAVVFATEAFGMGIDVPNVGCVLHLDTPPTLIDLYQEVGRGGRDGREVHAVVHTVARRASRRRFAAGVRNLEPDDCGSVATAIVGGATTRRAIRNASGLGSSTVNGGLSVLRSAGAVAEHGIEWIASCEPEANLIAELCRRRNSFHEAQATAVVSYASGATCRWVEIANSLGATAEPCTTCDVCDRVSDDPGCPDDDGESLTGVRIHHPTFGDGVVTFDDAEVITASFAETGPRRLQRAVVTDLPGVKFSETDV